MYRFTVRVCTTTTMIMEIHEATRFKRLNSSGEFGMVRLDAYKDKASAAQVNARITLNPLRIIAFPRERSAGEMSESESP
ncbi:hypothetical protein D3C76_1740440 [compost metagenome]